MSGGGLAVAAAGVEAAARRLCRYARAAPARTRSGEGWLAVATGVAANDMNGVVSRPYAPLAEDLIDDLLAWFAAQRLPASWLVAGEDPALTRALVDRGARSEASGWWAGRLIDTDLLRMARPSGITIQRVGADEDLEQWLVVAEQCGWIDHDADRNARRELFVAVGLDDDRLSHWVARRDGEPVGMASSFLSGGSVVDLCGLAVVAHERRRGIGRALACERIRSAHERGATRIVSALSPDGWELYRSLGFASAAVTPDRWFYLPTPAD